MRFFIALFILIGLSACNGGSNTSQSVSNDISKDVPQPNIDSEELQPPRPPTL